MEKLQQALQKARTQRADSVPPQGDDAQGPASEANSLDALWAALPAVEVDPKILTRNRIVSYEHGRDTAAFDMLRTKILIQMRKHGWRRIAITSPTAACGKSTVTCNLALGLSRQTDIRTVTFEIDLRRPTMAQMLGLKPAHDVTALLDGKVPFHEQAMRVRGNVALALARGPSVDPTRFLLSPGTEEVIAEIEARYAPDMMIFDVPPLLTADDTHAFLDKVDCALMVVRADATTVQQIDICEREIAERTNMLGVALNQCKYQDQASGYGYGY